MDRTVVETWWEGVQRWWLRLGTRRRSPSWGGEQAPAVPSAPAGSGVARWDPLADARERERTRLTAAGARLQAEHHRLQAERALDVVDLGAHERLAQGDRAHQVALWRFGAASGDSRRHPRGG